MIRLLCIAWIPTQNRPLEWLMLLFYIIRHLKRGLKLDERQIIPKYSGNYILCGRSPVYHRYGFCFWWFLVQRNWYNIHFCTTSCGDIVWCASLPENWIKNWRFTYICQHICPVYLFRLHVYRYSIARPLTVTQRSKDRMIRHPGPCFSSYMELLWAGTGYLSSDEISSDCEGSPAAHTIRAFENLDITEATDRKQAEWIGFFIFS